MAEDIAALAATIRHGTETEIGIAYALLIAGAGHDAADEIWAEAHRQVDAELGWPPPDVNSPRGICTGCGHGYALRADGRIRHHETAGWDSPQCAGGGEPPAPAGPA